MNNKDDDAPCLKIDEENYVIPSDIITYLGDIFNSCGNNSDLIADRLKRGMKAMVTIASLMAETDVGMHRISIMLLLYRSLFLSTMLFNSQTWSKVRQEHMDQLRTLQLKFLKRIMGVAVSTSNPFIFLELGVLPIEFEIDRRKLMYLHRILNLETSDPVYVTFINMMAFHKAGEENWWSDIEKALEKYDLPSDLEDIKAMSKDAFRDKVNKAVKNFAFQKLRTECHSQKKAANLTYETFNIQDYLLRLYPQQSRVIFKCRSETLDIKSHLTHKYKDLICRRCHAAPEEIQHIVNCGQNKQMDEVNYTNIEHFTENIEANLKLLANRVRSFIDG